MATSSRFFILLHGIFRLLPDHIRLLPKRISPNGRRSWCYSICLNSDHLPNSRDHVCGTSRRSCDKNLVLLLTHAIDQNYREMEPRILRSLGPVTPDIPYSDGCWTHHPFLRLCQSIRLYSPDQKMLDSFLGPTHYLAMQQDVTKRKRRFARHTCSYSSIMSTSYNPDHNSLRLLDTSSQKLQLPLTISPS